MHFQGGGPSRSVVGGQLGCFVPLVPDDVGAIAHQGIWRELGGPLDAGAVYAPSQLPSRKASRFIAFAGCSYPLWDMRDGLSAGEVFDHCVDVLPGRWQVLAAHLAHKFGQLGGGPVRR